METNRIILEQLRGALLPLVVDHDDDAARVKIKTLLESAITGSTVTIDPVNSMFPDTIRGTLTYSETHKVFHFQKKVTSSDACLVCGESMAMIRTYGCVAGIVDCVHERMR